MNFFRFNSLTVIGLLLPQLALGEQLAEIAALLGSDQAVTSIEISQPDNRTAIVADQTKKIIAWDIVNRKQLWTASLPKRAYMAAFTHDLKRVVVGGRYQMLTMYDLPSGKLSLEFERDSARHQLVHQVGRFTQDDRFLVTVATRGDELASRGLFYPEIHLSERIKSRERYAQTAMLWNAQSGKLIYSKGFTDATVYALGISGDDRVLYLASSTSVKLIDVQTGNEMESFAVDEYSTDVEQPMIVAVEFDRSMRFAILSLVGKVIVINVQSGKVIREWTTANGCAPVHLAVDDVGEFAYGVCRNGEESLILKWGIVDGRLESETMFPKHGVGRNYRRMISDYGIDSLVRISPENGLLIHAFPGEFGPSGSMLPGGTGLIVRRLP